ncbi:uncharacterized protein UV8b_05849 [Ustilaginoidea virens]|uniref:Uncharacterized protein n=1 Tax=Ustilaginoidea virens TaxID=1159556 RepID=A0A063CCD9_USTVR|nr:uncharacterized protein UV8b_05849 [Ustilaginoidea virens]QUC21606.1 hypothetical protein UV8b_05849 [Ustilaginoidea virens]GAO13575.1 hypothetical protein UVI_02015520 [Ustilaginoidea virens]
MRSLVVAALMGAALATGDARVQPRAADEAALCADRCTERWLECKASPGADRETCRAQYSSCLGFDHLDHGDKVPLPTACQFPDGRRRPLPRPPLEACARECNAEFERCRTAPQAPLAWCATDYSGCLGYIPFPEDKGAPFPSPTACVAKDSRRLKKGSRYEGCAELCTEEFQACRDRPGANPLFCASRMAQCLGYSPFRNGFFQPPTVCYKPKAPKTKTPHDSCARKCLNKYGACKARPGPTHDLCDFSLKRCVGYDPFQNGELPNRVSCAQTSSAAMITLAPRAVPDKDPPQNKCALRCMARYQACWAGPPSNFRSCRVNLRNCLGFQPDDRKSKFPTTCIRFKRPYCTTRRLLGPAAKPGSPPITTYPPLTTSSLRYFPDTDTESESDHYDEGKHGTKTHVITITYTLPAPSNTTAPAGSTVAITP